MSTIILPAIKTLPRTNFSFSVEEDDRQHADLSELELDDSQKSQASASSLGAAPLVGFRPDLTKTRRATNLFVNKLLGFGSTAAGSKPIPLEDGENLASTQPTEGNLESESEESTKQRDSSNVPNPVGGTDAIDAIGVEETHRNSSTNRESRGSNTKSDDKVDKLVYRTTVREGNKQLKKSKSLLNMERSSQHGEGKDKRGSRRGYRSMSPPRRPLIARQSASRAILASEVPGHHWVATSTSRPSRIQRTRSETHTETQRRSEATGVRKSKSSRSVREMSNERKGQRERKTSLPTALQRSSLNKNAAWEPRDSGKRRIRKQRSLRHQSSAKDIMQRVDSNRMQHQSSARNIMQRVDSIRMQQNQLKKGLEAQDRLSGFSSVKAESFGELLSDSSVHDSETDTDNEMPPCSYSHKTYVQTLEAMKKGIPYKDRPFRFKTYKDCFLGQDAVSFIQLYLKLESREEALRIGLEMDQKLSCWEHVSGDHELKDEQLFYRFSDSGSTQENLIRDVDLAEGAGTSFPKEAHLSQEAVASIAALVGLVGDLKTEVVALRQEVKDLRSLVDHSFD